MIAAKTIKKWIEPVQVIMALAVCLILVMIGQMIVHGISVERAQRIFEARRSQSVAVSQADRAQQELRESRREFLFDGTVVLVRQTTDPVTRQVKTVRVADANNRELYNGPPDKNPYTYISWSRESPAGYEVDTALEGLLDTRYGLTMDFSRMLCIRAQGPDQQRSVTWVYDPDLRAFAGYGSDGRFAGYLGAGGLTLQRREVQPLEEGLRLSRLKHADSAGPIVLWVSAHSLYLIDFDTAKVRQIFHSDSHSIQRVQSNHWDDPNTGLYFPSVTIFTEGSPTAVYLPQSQRLIPITAPSDGYWSASPVVATRQGLFLQWNTIAGAPSYRDRDAYLQWLQQNRDKPTQHIMRLMQVQDNGDLKLISSFEWTQPGRVYVASDALEQWRTRIGYVVGVVSPLPTRWTPVRLRYSYYDSYHYLSSLIQPFVRLDIYTPANLALTLVLVVLTFLHARPRRTGWGRLAFWLILVLLFNVAGFLTYLALNHTPVIRCPACGRRRGLARADCPHCHALLPVPQSRPTDLILPATCAIS